MMKELKKFRKKSQLYLITAITLSVIAFLLSDLPAKTQEGSKEPQMLYTNFVYEAPRVLNSAIYQNRNITDDFDDFADKFIYYAGTKNINLSLFYIIVYNNNMTIFNRLGSSANITTDSGKRVLGNMENISMAKKEKISIGFNDVSYPFNINDDETQFKLIFMTRERSNNTEVYVYG